MNRSLTISSLSLQRGGSSVTFLTGFDRRFSFVFAAFSELLLPLSERAAISAAHWLTLDMAAPSQITSVYTVQQDYQLHGQSSLPFFLHASARSALPWHGQRAQRSWSAMVGGQICSMSKLSVLLVKKP
jgi:hypothetical protein